MTSVRRSRAPRTAESSLGSLCNSSFRSRPFLEAAARTSAWGFVSRSRARRKVFISDWVARTPFKSGAPETRGCEANHNRELRKFQEEPEGGDEAAGREAELWPPPLRRSGEQGLLFQSGIESRPFNTDQTALPSGRQIGS